MKIIIAPYPQVEPLGGGLFSTKGPTAYRYIHRGAIYRLTVPARFVFDGASIPRLAWTPLGVTPADMLGESLPHDLIYHHQGKMPLGTLEIFKNSQWVPCYQTIERGVADELLLELCQHYGTAASKYARPFLIWSAVRLGGYFAWRRDDEERKALALDDLGISAEE
jgi:hypothetical protein